MTVQVLAQELDCQRAWTWLEPRIDPFIEEIVNICEIPAPTFAETERARWVRRRFQDIGLKDVHTDGIGNVLGRLGPRRTDGPVLVISAHLDTVFPAEVDVTVRRHNGRLYAPGISDNSASVAAMIYVAWALLETNYIPDCEIWFVGNVGEEGLGDLRGMKHLLQKGLGQERPVTSCLIFDGSLGMICHQAIGSRRLRISFSGPGGHSWGNYGRPNAIHGAAQAIVAITNLDLPQEPRTTLNVGLVSGGLAVNSIAEEATFWLDLRSVETETLQLVEEEVRQLCRQTAAAQDLQTAIKVVGDRPAGSLSARHPLVSVLQRAARRAEVPAYSIASSTDANVPLAMGIPALCIGVKRGRGAHTLDEYLEINSLQPGLRFALLATVTTDRYLGNGRQQPG